MSRLRARGPRAPLDVAALGGGILVLGWLGWDVALWDPRQQALLHLVAAVTVVGVAVAAARGAELPRTPLEVPLLALLAAYALATASAMNHGMSLRAVASVLAFAAMLPVALIAVRHRPTWVGVVTAVPVLALSVPTLALLVGRRLEWIAVGAPGLPPLRLLNEGTAFGSVAVPPFVIWPAWALAGLIGPPRWRRIVRLGLVATGVPLTILSGSRSAWLAIAAAALIALVPWLWARRSALRPDRWVTPSGVVATVAALALAAAAAVLVVPRLTAIGSLLYRAGLWRDTLAAWSTDPLLGIGPGFMPYARQAAAPDFSFPVRQPHSHNLPLGVLGDAGLIGLAAALVVVGVALAVAGPWRCRTATGRTAALVLVGLGIGGLFEDLTFLPNFNLLAIALLAVALTDAGSVRWVRLRTGSTRRRVALALQAFVVAAALAPPVVLGDVAAVAHHAGIDAWRAGRPADAAEHLALAASLDRWNPAAPKALAVAADASGDHVRAREAAEVAVALNPGDGASWANLAVLCRDAGDRACAVEAADRAAATATFLGLELANAAVVQEAAGRADAADDAYRSSLLSQRLTAFGLDWPRDPSIGDLRLADDHGALGELNLVLAWWAVGDPIDPEALAIPAVRALAHGMRDEWDPVDALLDEAVAAAPDDPLPWQLAIVLRQHRGEPVDDEVRAWHALTGQAFPSRDDRPRVPRVTDDIASFRTYPADELVRAAERLETDPIWPWVLVEALP